MTTSKTSLAVAALENGTVMNHIPSESLFRVVHLLNLEDMHTGVTIGNNLPSASQHRKGIIKIEGVEFDRDTLNRIAIIAPTATVNIIRNYAVFSKHPVELPEELVGLVRCSNPKCITNFEPMATRFHVQRGECVELCCHYCNHSIRGEEAEII